MTPAQGLKMIDHDEMLLDMAYPHLDTISWESWIGVGIVAVLWFGWLIRVGMRRYQ